MGARAKGAGRRGGLPVTRELAHAAAWDAGNRHMREHGRTAWNEDDYNACVETFNRLWPESKDAADALEDRR